MFSVEPTHDFFAVVCIVVVCILGSQMHINLMCHKQSKDAFCYILYL